MKKIFVCTQVQNDSDIIESFCRYYCSFCDGVLVRDDQSSDNTLDILQSLADEGLPVFIANKYQFDFSLGLKDIRRQLFRFACENFNADVVLPIDADEFLINVNGGSPRTVLDSFDENVEYHVRRRNYFYPGEIKNDTVFFPCATEKYTILQSPKTIMHRYLIVEKNAYPAPGCHFFHYSDTQQPEVVEIKELCYNHYPVRGLHQFMVKIILGSLHCLTLPYHEGDKNYNLPWHWKEFYEEIKKNGYISREKLEQYSVYSSTSIPDDDNYQLSTETFDTSFCNEALKLRYTKYDANKDYFLPVLAAQLEKNLLRMPSWRSNLERKIEEEQMAQLKKTINNLNEHIEMLNKKISSSEQSGNFYFFLRRCYSKIFKRNKNNS